jgi:serine/threonine protein kinase
MSTKCPTCHSENPDNQKFCGGCGTKLDISQDASPSVTKTLKTPTKGVRIGATFAERYRIVDELGRGGMGIVYKAEDLRLERMVALKFLPPELTQDEEAKERFVLEARAAAAISHPNICTIHEIDEFEGQTYIAMEFVDGQSLRDITKKETIPVVETLELAIQVASGLEEAHKKGIIHRDIKSANIMVTDSGQAKVMDFGLAKVSGGALITQEGVTMGTVAYMSPEQARGEKVDNRTDIWSLGVVLYEILSGQLPFWGEKEASILYSIEHRDHKPVRAVNPDIPAELVAVIDRCLQKKPNARFKTAEEIISALIKYQDSLRAEEAGFFNLKSLLRRLRQPKVAVPAAMILLTIAALTVWQLSRRAKIRWARTTLLPEVGRLVENSLSNNTIDAFNKAVEAERYLPDDPILAAYMDRCSLNISITTTPPGARVLNKAYAKPEADWTFVGTSPIENLRVPYGYFRWKLEKEGFETVLAAACTHTLDYQAQENRPLNLERTLDPVGSLPAGMVRILGFGKLDDYFLDRFEVTNRQYREFMDRGGYQNETYWKHPFIKDGKTIPWEEAVREFVDSTGRPGPSTWEGGTFPSGWDDYPVSGVSWYEAAAYAEFAGKSLPSNNVWRNALYTATAQGFLSVLTPLSNYGADGPAAVGSHTGVSYYGALDMAGNVREWGWNESPEGRVIMGGAWNDATYVVFHTIDASAFNRSAKNGIRCVKYQDMTNIPDWVFQPRNPPKFPDYTQITPVSDDVFTSLRERYFYDPSDLNIEVEDKDDSSPYWNIEKVTYAAAYGNERTGACLFLPKNTSPPYQAVIYVPGSGEMFIESSDHLEETMRFKYLLEFLVKDGRAVIYPLYKGFFERGNPQVYYPLHQNFNSYECAEFWNCIVKDFRRSLDYLETRSDIDVNKVAVYSYSWGIFAGTILPAIEDRLAVNVMVLSGLGVYFSPTIDRAEMNPVNFVRRVTVPTLLLSGEHDPFFPLETSAKPLFELLGTSDDQKHHRIYDSDHIIQKNLVIKDVLWFFDKYLGPAKTAGKISRDKDVNKVPDLS